MENNFLSLYNQFKEVMDKGTEEQAQQFLVDHLKEFPEDVKNEIVFSLFESGVNEMAAQDSAMLTFKKEGLELASDLEKALRILDDKLKVLDLQEKI
jgi:hypothetical protein